MSKLLDFIKTNGSTPRVGLTIRPLSKDPAQRIQNFLSYSFQSSVLIPVDAFSFSFNVPNATFNVDTVVREGDLVELTAGDQVICTGIVDVVEIDTSLDGGVVIQIMGRNLLGMLEDQSAVNADDKPFYFTQTNVFTAVKIVAANTRLRGVKPQDAPLDNGFLFATEPCESKMSAIMRFIDPLNCLVWGSPDGFMIVGRPNMGANPVGDIFCSRIEQRSNVMAIKAVRSSTQIPNVIIPIWTGQEAAIHTLAQRQRLNNAAEGPTRLRTLGHVIQKTVVSSTPSGNSPNSASEITRIKVGGTDILGAMAVKECARSNLPELIVQATVKSHYNDDLLPFLVDQVYNVNYPTANVQEKMYLYQVEYSMDVKNGPRTVLNFCKLGCLVAGVSLVAAKKTVYSADGLNLA